MEKRRVKKPRGLKWLLASFFCRRRWTVWFCCWCGGWEWAFYPLLVYPANAAQQAARASSQAVLENGALFAGACGPTVPLYCVRARG